MQDERRAHPRYDIMTQIRVKRGRTNFIMEVSNISRGGIYVTTESISQLPQFREGQELEMDLFTLDENLDNIRVRGKIVRVFTSHGALPPGFGVQFVLMDEENRSKLYRMVDHAAMAAQSEPPPRRQKPPPRKRGRGAVSDADQ